MSSTLSFQSPLCVQFSREPHLSLQSPLPNRAEPSPTQQESSAWPLDPLEVVAQPPVHNEVAVPSLGRNQAQHSDLFNVIVKSADLELTITPEPPTLYQDCARYPPTFNITVQPLNLRLTINPETAWRLTNLQSYSSLQLLQIILR